MRIAIRIIQFFVGLLFIVSGLVKANDPLGLSYKMQEFFELWKSEIASGHSFLKNSLVGLFDALHSQSLTLSILMIALEIMAGVALLIAWKKNFILWLLLALILFFTFLTGYAYLSGKFTNCGCFGDCLPITPLTSFGKDLILTAMILVLLFGKKYITPIGNSKQRRFVLVVSLLVTFLLQVYALNYLPVVDCLPFKKGNNIAEQTKAPVNAVQDSFDIKFIYEKKGKQYEFAPESLPPDFNTYKFIDRKQTLVRKGNADPPIKGFSLTGLSGQDSASVILAQPEAVLFFSQNSSSTWVQEVNPILNAAKAQKIPVYIASPSAPDALALFKSNNSDGIQFFSTDFTVVRTAARTDPTLYILERGTIKKKYSKNSLRKAASDLSSGNF